MRRRCQSGSENFRENAVSSAGLGLCAGNRIWPCTVSIVRIGAQCAGYVLVGQSHDLPQRFYRRHSGRNALLHAVRKELLDDVFITRLSQLSRKRDRLRRILLLFQRKGVCIHTTEIDLRYDLYRHGLDNVLVGGF